MKIYTDTDHMEPLLQQRLLSLKFIQFIFYFFFYFCAYIILVENMIININFGLITLHLHWFCVKYNDVCFCVSDGYLYMYTLC